MAKKRDTSVRSLKLRYLNLLRRDNIRSRYVPCKIVIIEGVALESGVEKLSIILEHSVLDNKGSLIRIGGKLEWIVGLSGIQFITKDVKACQACVYVGGRNAQGMVMKPIRQLQSSMKLVSKA